MNAPPSIQAEEESLKNLYRQINQAMLDKDTAKIDALTDAGFTLTHITGYKQSKDEWLNHIATGQMQYHQIDEKSVKAFINDNRADIIGQAKTQATIWGTHGTWYLQLHYTAVKDNGQWRADKAVATLF